ncbi:EamA family transporter [Actinocatenispora sera]|uniref:EamA family transporter n=1 Tax=Actinocatenispora sera TaxID=390989 RepID=UPI0034037239
MADTPTGARTRTAQAAGALAAPAGSVAARTALTALAPVVWGTTYLVTSQWLPPGHPLWSATLRALPAGLIALALGRRLPRGVWWWRAALLGTLNIGAFFALLFVAAYRLPGGVAAILGALQPLAVAALAYGLLRERPTLWRLGWAIAGAGGVAVIVLRAGAALDPVGIVAGSLGTAGMAAGVVLSKRWRRPVGVLAYTGWQLTAGGLLLLPLAVLVEGALPPLDLPALGGYLWLGGVGTLLAYGLWFTGIGRLPVTALSFLPLLSPVVAAAVGWLVLGQSLGPLQVAGFVLALGAIAAAQFAPRRRTARPTPEDNPSA